MRTTSDNGSASRSRRPESMPARTRSDSAFRRIRVARWSSRKRLASACGSSSVRSRESMKDSCRLRSTWSRRATLTNISAIEPRRAACSCATWKVVRLTALNAPARRPTSSRDVTGICGAVICGPSPGLCTCSTRRGSSSRRSVAAAVRRRSGMTIVRAITSARKKDRTTARIVTPPVRKARCWAALMASEVVAWAALRTLSETSVRLVHWAVISSSKDFGVTEDIWSASPVPMSSRSFWNPAFGSPPGSARPMPSPATEARAASR